MPPERYTRWLDSQTTAQLEQSLANARTLAELGERRILDLQLQPEPDAKEINANLTMLRTVLAHIKSVEIRLAERSK